MRPFRFILIVFGVASIGGFMAVVHAQRGDQPPAPPPAAAQIDEGIKTQTELFARVEQKLAEIERLRAELRGMVGERKTEEPVS